MQAWLKARAPAWRELTRHVERLRRQRTMPVREALATVEAYRNIARDLASARRLVPGTRTVAALEALFAELHATVSRQPAGGWQGLLGLLRDEVPVAARELAPRIVLMALLMAASAAGGYWLIATYPTLVSLIASESMIQHVEAGQLWTDGILNITPSSVMSVRIFANNIAVALFAICSGFLFGLGTFYLIVLNGLMLGSVFAFVHRYGLAGRLFEFIIAHGPVELSVICIAGAIGTAIAEAIIRPTAPTRGESFRRCVRRLGPLIGLCALLLVGAGLIEGFVSPNPIFPLVSRVVLGVFYWLVMMLALAGRLVPAPGAIRPAGGA